jgi:hypothetical protein
MNPQAKVKRREKKEEESRCKGPENRRKEIYGCEGFGECKT